MKAVKPASDVLIRSLQRSFVGGLGYAAFLSLCVNLLLLTVPLFMMQVQDRVIVSQNHADRGIKLRTERERIRHQSCISPPEG